ncbi:probable polygalacturonase At3g15720 [Pistacia vera]|uniref:probable polygalacturonase At3g15720 n=1 Tax=Pistacia vera TaxID=55513 RepID=UPI001262FAB9|nr:probable polygalacturonase At3g15720 [Pistacia vera]
MQKLLAAGLFMLCFGIGYSQPTFHVGDFGAIGDGHTDDSQAFLKAWKQLCEAGGTGRPTLEIPASTTFLLKPTLFQGPCNSNDLHLQVLGDIIAPNTTSEWNGNRDCWLCFRDVNGLVIEGSGTINGRGFIWWNTDVKLHTYSIRKHNCTRPRAVHFHNCNNLQITGISLVNSPKSHISINQCTGVSISRIQINSPCDSPNTDGIHISSSTNLDIQHSIIKTGDDCIAVNTGSSFINITGVACGPGHGISVGSLGEDRADDRVEEVHVRDCNFSRTQNGARIKTFRGGSGYARKISFEQITLIDSKNPIIIDQHYTNDGKRESSSAVKVSDVTYSGVQGTSAEEQAITLNCSDEIGCFNIKMKKIKISSSVPGKKTHAYCNNAHGTSTLTTPNVPCLLRLDKFTV